jgi:hypothetical protein
MNHFVVGVVNHRQSMTFDWIGKDVEKALAAKQLAWW